MTDPIKQLEDKIAALEYKLNTHTAAISLAHVSKIYPKNRTVIFVGQSYFGDNIKYAFLAFQKIAASQNINCYFLTPDPAQHVLLKSHNLPVLTASDPDYLQTLLSAKVAVLLDNLYPLNTGTAPHALLQGAKFIQLWHGIPLKEIGLMNFCQPDVLAACGPLQALVATNASSEADWRQRFYFDEFAPIGYPRNDIFFREPSKQDLINVDQQTLALAQAARVQNQPVVFYAPTFRDHVGPSWFLEAQIASLAEYCQDRGAFFCINLHPGEQRVIGALRQHYPQLHFIAPHTDAYPILKHATCVITDYSSLALDYLLLDRPIIFYRPDHQDYTTRARHLIPGREHYTAGPVTYNIKDLIAACDTVLAATPESDPHKAARHELRKELFDERDGNAAARVNDLILKYLE